MTLTTNTIITAEEVNVKMKSKSSLFSNICWLFEISKLMELPRCGSEKLNVEKQKRSSTSFGAFLRIDFTILSSIDIYIDKLSFLFLG